MTLDLVARVLAAATAALTAALGWYSQHADRRRSRAELVEDLNVRDRLREGSLARDLLEESIERRIEARFTLTTDQADGKTRFWPGILASISCFGFASVAAYYALGRGGLQPGWLALTLFLTYAGATSMQVFLPRRRRDHWGEPVD